MNYSSKSEQTTPVEERKLHNSYIKELIALFEKKDYRVIIEGAIPQFWGKEWAEPDIFVLKGLRLEKIVEVTISDSKEGKEPNSVLNKCKKIREYYNPPEIIVFEPTGYTDNHYPKIPKGFAHHSEYNAYLQEKWRKEGLNVTFWNEWNLEEQKEKANEP